MKYLAHVEYEILYSGKRLHSMTQDTVVDAASHCYSNGEEWDVVEFKVVTMDRIPATDRLLLDITVDICDDNNQFIMSTHMKKQLREKAVGLGMSQHEACIRIYVPIEKRAKKSKGYKDGVNNTLDKLREKIEKLPIKTRVNWDGCCPDIDYPDIEYVDVTKNELLDIIDRYKTESEDSK